MSRLPSPPDLEWKPDGTPVARGFGDVYFSTADGLEESRVVFLAACGLPERWAGQQQFTVAETGFGTGLNFLALWDLWQKARPPQAWLHFVSFEGFPLYREDAEKALSVWPELSELSEKLLARWPHRARGVRRLRWPEHRISLTLHLDDIAAALPEAEFQADAWFLDGFSPSRNGEMWDPSLYPAIAARSAPGAVAATFTVARAVREGLSAAGFEVSKRPGFGRKRDRLEAVFAGSPIQRADPFALRGPDQGPRRVAILGAGIAGASLAAELRAQGLEPVVFDPAGPAAKASGNRLALVMPRLDAGDTVQARLLIDAYIHARETFAGMPGAESVDVHQPPRNDADRTRFAKVLDDPPLPLEDLEALQDGGLLHKRALILRPAELVSTLLEGSETVFGSPVTADLENRIVNGECFDAVIIASGMALAETAPWLGLVGKLGQVESVSGAPAAPTSAIAAGHYAIASGTERLWGATFETAHGPIAETSPAARAANQDALEGLSPWWLPQIKAKEIESRADIRATTPDRLPIAGPLPDFAGAMEVLAPLKHGRDAGADGPNLPGIYLLGGLGSRGFTFAPWLASLLAAQLTGAPQPATRSALQAVSAMRILRRALKRGQNLPGQK